MPDVTKLRVLARGTGRVPDYQAQSAGIRRFHGWKHDPKLGPEFVDPVTKQKKNHGGYVRQSDVVELPVTTEYIRHLRVGDLWPADEATAQLVGRPFEPDFGGEHPSMAPEAKESPAPAHEEPAPVHDAGPAPAPAHEEH